MKNFSERCLDFLMSKILKDLFYPILSNLIKDNQDEGNKIQSQEYLNMMKKHYQSVYAENEF